MQKSASSPTFGAGSEQPHILFADTPNSTDYRLLAEHLEQAHEDQVHIALFPQRVRVASSLRRMAETPDETAHRNAYHTLRLFVF